MAVRTLLFSLALVSACESEPVAPPAPVEPVEAQPEKVADLKLDAAQLQAQPKTDALVPSPAEMQATLTKAGLTAQLGTMVADRDVVTKVENLDQTAVRTGVVLADLVLTIKDAPKERVVAQLGRLKEGLGALGAGADTAATLDDLINRVKTEAVTRDDLIKEMDELSGVMVPELKFEGKEWMVPLIQAGSWLEGAHLVAGAIKAEGKADTAAHLLQQPAVVDHFLKYVQHEGRNKAPDAVVDKLQATLLTLKEVTGKPTLTAEDIETIHSATGAVLTLL
jgi:hypothetical protein